MMAFSGKLSVLPILLAASPAPAAEIPVEIHWLGNPPDSILSGNGTTPLVRDSAARVFRGTVSVNGNAWERRVFIVGYGRFNHPIDVRVHRVSPPIRFTIRYTPSPSCTDGRVTAFSRPPSNLVDAVDRTLSASQLLSIERPNDCDEDLRFRAAEARYLQNVKMSELSNGLFLVNPAIAEEYRKLAGVNFRAVQDRLSADAVAEAGREADQLILARNQAEQAGSLDRAAEINSFMLQRIHNGEGVRELFRREGVTRERLLYKATYLDRAGTTAMAAPAPPSRN